MIVPMKKITLVVLDREREQALEALRKTGVLHVEKREASSQSLSELQALVSRIDQACGILSDFAVKTKKSLPEYTGREQAMDLLDRVFALRDERRVAQDSVSKIDAELERLAVWGEMDPADFSYLAGKGIHLFPAAMAPSDYASIPPEIRTLTVDRGKKEILCLICSEDGKLPEGLPSGSRFLALPEKSTASMREERAAAGARIQKAVDALTESALSIDSLLELKAEVMKDLEFETIRAGMPQISLGEEQAVYGKTDIAWLTGFVPLPREGDLVAAAKKHGWAYMSEDPSDDDIVPTEIQNNRFVNIISPLLDFLGTVPGYRELDISVWFLLFFGIFFAMIFGDGGYGALLVGISLFGILSSLRKKEKAPTALFMLLYLGAMTVAWGTVTCTWFGIPVESLPGFLRTIALPAFSNENPEAGTNIKVFCFTLGLIQISLAHIIGIIRNRRSLKLLGEAGALVLAIGMYFVVLNLVVDAEKYPLTNLVLGMVLGGFVVNFLFVNYAGSFVGGIVESLKNIITMILGVVNMFGDIMSYIRLWAVGLAGSAISSTINTMAGPMLGGFIIFAGVILLLFGHGLNTVMNVLSVLVHGVRLNTLEFSNHLGLTWSGFKYEPFAETGKK